jgi:hypothetical protein
MVVALLATLLGGCAAFENSTMVVVQEAPLDDGTWVELVRCAVTGPLSRKESVGLARFNCKYPIEGPVDLSQPSSNDNLLLRVDSGKRRAWVCDRASNTVLLSVDYQEERVWHSAEKQPDWARLD